MKKIIFLILLSMFVFTGCKKTEAELSSYERIMSAGEINVGISDIYPFGFFNEETQTYDGFDTDIAKNIATDLLGNAGNVNYTILTPDERIEAITSNEVDMIISTMSITPQREYFIDFSIPYYTIGQTAIVNADSEIHSFLDLKDKKIIVLLGTTSEKNIRKLLPAAKIIGYKSSQEALQAFIDGQGDAYTTDNSILFNFVKEHPEYRMLKNKISREYYAVGLKKEENNKLKRNVDMVITRMIKNGSLMKLKQKWNIDNK